MRPGYIEVADGVRAEDTRLRLDDQQVHDRDSIHDPYLARTVLTSTPTEFRRHARPDAYDGDERVYAHTWRLTIPRDHV